MSIAYSDIYTEISNNLQIDTADRDKFNMQNTVNRAQLLLLNILPAEFITNAIKTKKLSIFNGESGLQLPDNFIRLEACWIDYVNPITDSNTGTSIRISEVGDIGLMTNLDTMASKEFPTASLSAQGGWEIDPIPDADVVNGFRAKYIYMLPDITDTQNCLLRDRLRNLLVFAATAYSAAVNNHDNARSGQFWDKFTFELEMLYPNAKSRLRGQYGRFRDYVGGKELLRS